MALDDLHTWRIGQDGNCKEFDAAVHSHVDNLLSKHSNLEPDEKNMMDLFRSLKGAHDGYQNAWKHAQAHGLDDPAVSPVEAAAAKEGWKLSVANLHDLHRGGKETYFVRERIITSVYRTVGLSEHRLSV